MLYNAFCSYEEFMDRNPRVIRKHQNADLGCAYLTRGSEFYGVTVIEYTKAGNEVVRTRGRMDSIAAEDFFNIAKQFIDGKITWREPVHKFKCAYDKNQKRICSPENCPSALGGREYREIFGSSCPFCCGRSR
jgi:hypothetical protein